MKKETSSLKLIWQTLTRISLTSAERQVMRRAVETQARHFLMRSSAADWKEKQQQRQEEAIRAITRGKEAYQSMREFQRKNPMEGRKSRAVYNLGMLFSIYQNYVEVINVLHQLACNHRSDQNISQVMLFIDIMGLLFNLSWIQYENLLMLMILIVICTELLKQLFIVLDIMNASFIEATLLSTMFGTSNLPLLIDRVIFNSCLIGNNRNVGFDGKSKKYSAYNCY